MGDRRKEELIESVVNVEFEVADKDHINLKQYKKIPLTEIAGLGATISSLFPNFRQISAQTQVDAYALKGLYRCNFKNGVSGTLAKARDGSGYLGSVMNNGKIVGQARFTPVNQVGANQVFTMPVNPYGAFIAVALVEIDHKLDKIEKLGQDILNYQRERDKAEQQANFESLIEVYNKYKYNVKNEKWQMLKYADVQNIKRDTSAKIKLWNSQIQDHMDKCGSIHNNMQVQQMIDRVQDDFQSYRLGVYMYSLATFLETLLLGNFSQDYLKSVAKDIHDMNLKYQKFYKKCYDKLKKISSSAVESVALKGVADLSHNVGKGIRGIPLINKSPFDKALTGLGKDIKKFDKKMVNNSLKKLSNMESHAEQFEKEVNQINKLYNSPMDLMIDEKNVYLKIK